MQKQHVVDRETAGAAKFPMACLPLDPNLFAYSYESAERSRKECIMKRIAIPFVSGCGVAILAAVSLWQLIAVALLVHTMAIVLSALGNLL